MVLYNRIDARRKLVAGIGSALVDILAHEDDDFVENVGAVKGGMVYVDKNGIDDTIGMTGNQPAVVPGGSACNTMVGIGQLGGLARFVGKCGSGSMGRLIRSDLERQNVEPYLFKSDVSPTGRVMSIITPDAQRSMLTYLGAAAEIDPNEITADCFKDAAIVHIEGYLLFNQALFSAILEAARDSGALISLDLASFNVVEEAKEVLTGHVKHYVDILIANEDEALAYTGIKNEAEALEALAGDADLAVLKIGPRGSLIAHKGQHLTIQPQGEGDGSAVDTTGAGDLWASGFLYGLINQMPLDQCGALGSRCGHAVCQVVGANIPEEQWITIRKSVEE